MKFSTLIAVASAATTIAASAASISIDFNNTTDGSWTLSGTEVGGPTSTIYWNTTSTASGTSQALHDDSNTATGATIDWASQVTYTNGDGNSTNDRQLAHAFLDDGLNGQQNPSVTISNIPYTTYRIYGLVAADASDTYTTRDFQVNGTWVFGNMIQGNGAAASTAQAYKGIAASGGGWVEITGNGAGSQTQTGNYWVFDSSGSTLTIEGQNRNLDERGSFTGLVIVDTTVPEPSSVALLGVGGLALMFRRKK